MFGLGAWEIGIILLVILVIFGPSQLPKIGRSFGETIKELKGIKKEIEK